MGILHLAKANIRKNKSNSITLALIVIVVSMLASLGLSVLFQIDGAFDKKADELNSFHYAFGVSRDKYDEKYEAFFKNDSRVTDYEKETAVFMVDSQIEFGGRFDTMLVLLDKETSRRISPLKLLEEDENVSRENAIYLPYIGKNIGYNTGDAYTITYRNKPYSFVVAGFFESAELSRTTGAAMKHYLSSEAFLSMKAQIGESIVLSVRISKLTEIETFYRNFRDTTDVDMGNIMNSGILSVDYETGKMPTITPIMLFAAVLVAFAVIAVLISLLVINFRVSNSIEDRMHNIGTLFATGYTYPQILASFLMEYALVALPAALLGIGVSAAFVPGINGALESMTGLLLTLPLRIDLGLAAAVIITVVLLLMVLASGRRVKKLSPVVALRGGLATHNFRRNLFRLDKGIGNVDLRLGMKNIFAYGKLYAMICAVMTGIAVVVTFVVMSYINFSLDTSAFVKMVGIEISDVAVTVTKGTDANALASEIASMEDVRKVGMLDMVGFKIETIDMIGTVSDDFSTLENIFVHEGRYPEWDNEIALPETFAKKCGKEIGDKVEAKKNGIVKEYVICGYYSTTNNNGNVAILRLDGYQRLDPDYKRTGINIYLNNGVTFDEFSAKLQERFGVINVLQTDPNDKHAAAKMRAEEKISAYLSQYGVDSIEYAVSYNGEVILKGGSSAYQISKITNWREYLNTQINAFSAGMPILLGFISLVSLLFVTLILYMTVKSIILKRRVELGILKAGGFLTKQLVAQMALSFMPATIFGTGLGCIGGALLLNPSFLSVFSVMGVSRVDFVISPLAIAIIFMLQSLVTIGVAALSSLRIKNISVYELLSE